MPDYRQAQADEDLATVRELFWQYLHWANGRVNEEFGVNFDIATMLEDDMRGLDVYFTPSGRLLLISEDGQSAGLACLKKLRDGVREVKRLYVRAECRGRGLGRGMLEVLLSEASRMGYSTVRLDSRRLMRAAYFLYRSEGFQEIEPYDCAESAIPPEFREHWISME